MLNASAMYEVAAYTGPSCKARVMPDTYVPPVPNSRSTSQLADRCSLRGRNRLTAPLLPINQPGQDQHQGACNQHASIDAQPAGNEPGRARDQQQRANQVQDRSYQGPPPKRWYPARRNLGGAHTRTAPGLPRTAV